MLDAGARGRGRFAGHQPTRSTVAFGANMTTLTLAFSRALARTWQAGDEIVVTRLDHDANVTPWVLAARDAGATVRHVGIRPDDCTLDLDDSACEAVAADAAGGRGLRVECGRHDQSRGRDGRTGARGRRAGVSWTRYTTHRIG